MKSATLPTAPFTAGADKTSRALFTRASRYHKNSATQMNRLNHLSSDPRSALFVLFRRQKGDETLCLVLAASRQRFLNLNHSNEVPPTYTMTKKYILTSAHMYFVQDYKKQAFYPVNILHYLCETKYFC
jgi:hypothetical protein